MKRLFDEDLDLRDVKNYIKNLHKKQDNKKAMFIFGAVFGVLIICGIVVSILKYKKCCPFSRGLDDFEDLDMEGSELYATESDFE